jgi:hypothetical protein
MLSLLALISFQALYPDCPSYISEEPESLESGHLLDFRQYLDGGKLASSNSLRQMAHCLWSIVGDSCSPRVALFFNRVEAELPEQSSDIRADIYWSCRIEWSYDHSLSWTRAWASLSVAKQMMLDMVLFGREMLSRVQRRPRLSLR